MLLSFAVLLCQVGCHSTHEEKEAEVKFTVTSAVKLDTTYKKDYVSQIKSVRNIELRAMERGYLEQILVDEGQTVRKGQLMFKIMPRMFEAELKKAKAEVNLAEIEVQNAKNLADKNIVSANEYAMAKAKLEKTKAEYDVSRLHLTFTEVRAPFSGTIDRIPLKLGSLVEEGELLTSLSDNSEMFAYFNVSEPEYLDYQKNVANRASKQVNLILANNELFEHKGIVETIEGEFENETGNIAFRARFPNTNKLLRNGETGMVQMLVPMVQALLIPQRAIYEIQDKKYVYIIGPDGKATAKQIQVGASLEDLFVVTSGLDINDKFLLDGLQKIKEGDKINYSFIKPMEAIHNLKLKTE